MKQAHVAGHIVAAVLITLLLQGSAGLLPIGALAVLVMPLPAAYVQMRHGFWSGCAVVAAAALVIVAVGGQGQSLGYLLSFGLASLLLPLLLRHNLPWDRAVARSLLLLLGVGGLFLYGLATMQQTGITPLVENYLQGEIDTALALAKDMDLPAAQAAQFEATVRRTGSLLMQAYPAAALVGYGTMLLATLFGLSLMGRSRYCLSGLPFDQWKVPELWIWGLIVGGAGVLFVEGPVAVAALNLLLVMVALYFLQGLAIVSYFFRTRRVSPLLRTLGYLLLATLNPLPVLVAGIGVFDLWIDFRKPRNDKD